MQYSETASIDPSAGGRGRITVKTPAEQDLMRVAGRLTAEVLDLIASRVQPGVTTAELDRICHEHIVDVQHAVPAPLGYRGFPKSICTSVNHVVCHGIPGDKRLKSGDIINVDVTVIHEGFHGDSSRMFVVGKGTPASERLIAVTYHAMWLGIRTVRPGLRLGEIGKAIQRYVEDNHYSVVRDFCGHGIGRGFHEDPQVLHYYDARSDRVVLEPGMTFTIEPMVNMGKPDVRILPDGWTTITRDHSLSAQWEHTVLVTAEGHEVLTLGSAETPPV